MMNHTPEQLGQALLAAPAQVRFFIEEGLLADRLEKIAQKNSLSIPVAVSFAKLGEAALLGLIPPAQFAEELVSIGIPAASGQAIATTFHEEVVKKAIEIQVPKTTDDSTQEVELRSTKDDMKQRMFPEGHPDSPGMTASIARPGVTSISKPTPVEAPRPITTPVLRPLATTPAHLSESQENSPMPPQSVRPRTMASDVESMQTGRGEQRIPTPTTAPTPRPATPSLRPTPPVMQPPVRPTVPDASTVHEDLKKYGVDPYREPIE